MASKTSSLTAAGVFPPIRTSIKPQVTTTNYPIVFVTDPFDFFLRFPTFFSLGRRESHKNER